MSTRTPSQKSVCAYRQARRRRLMALGQWQPFADAEPVREHIGRIKAAGMSYAALCERLDLPQSTSLQHLLWGRGKYGPGQKVRWETAELILAYWPSPEDFPDTALIDATGTRRRVEALAVRGWARHLVASRIGMNTKHFRKVVSRPKVTARVARGVSEAYNAWWNQDPLEHGVPLSSVSRVQADAARSGFYGPLAWDDDTIDDPNEVPVTDALEPLATEGENVADRWLHGESVVLGSEDRKRVLQHLMEWTNQTPQEIADQLEITLHTLWQTWSRLKKQARMEGRTEPWRRVYVPRERDLKQTEMEEAA